MKTENIKGALAVQFVSRYANIIIQVLLNAVLARLLSPEDYGLLAIVTVFTAFFALFSDMGIGPAIVQFGDLNNHDYDVLFSFSILLGCLLTLLFVLGGNPIAAFYGDSRLVPLFQAIAPSILFNTLNMVPNGVLLKRKAFGSIGKRLVVSTVVGGLTAVVLAFMGLGVYALAANVVLQSVVVFFWNYCSTGLRPHISGMAKAIKRVFSYSIYQLGFSFVNYFSRNLDNLLIGRFINVEALGIYDKAYKLTTYPVTYLSGVIGSVLQPYLAEYQNNYDYMYGNWVKITKALSLAAAVIAAGIFCFAHELVLIMYGSSWLDAVVPLKLISLSLYFQIVNNPTGAIFQSAGRTDLLFRHSLISTGLTVLAILPGLAMKSLLMVAAGVGVAYCVHTVPIMHYLVNRIFHKKIKKHIALFLPEIITAGVAMGINALLEQNLPTSNITALIIRLAAFVSLFAVVYSRSGQTETLKRLLGKNG